MICPICKEQGLKSIVYDTGGTSTAMSYHSFYDEEGKHHLHDPNTIMRYFICNKKHKFVKRSSGGCFHGDYERKIAIEAI